MDKATVQQMLVDIASERAKLRPAMLRDALDILEAEGTRDAKATALWLLFRLKAEKLIRLNTYTTLHARVHTWGKGA